MEETKQEKQVIQQLFIPTTTFPLSLRDVATLEAVLQPLVWAGTLIQNVKNQVASEGNTVATYKEDYLLNRDGSFVLKDGQPVLKDNFWDKYLPKEETKTLTVEEEKKVVESN